MSDNCFSYLMCPLKKLVRVCKVSINMNGSFASIISTLFETAVKKESWLFQYVPDKHITQKLCEKSAEKNPYNLKYKNQKKAVLERSLHY